MFYVYSCIFCRRMIYNAIFSTQLPKQIPINQQLTLSSPAWHLDPHVIKIDFLFGGKMAFFIQCVCGKH